MEGHFPPTDVQNVRQDGGVLIREVDDTTGPDEWRAFLVAQGFGHLVAAGRGREVPVVVPTQFIVDGDDVVLHLAKPNPVWSAIDENPTVLLSVAGDWAYVPGAWKAVGEEAPAVGIPTTYYGAVQLTARAEVLDDPEAVLSVLRLQLGVLEPDGLVDPAHHVKRLPAIRGLRLHVTGVAAKFKYGGNVDADHRLAVADRLAARNGPGDAAARAHLLERLERDR
jgi:transcriptional regulator